MVDQKYYVSRTTNQLNVFRGGNYHGELVLACREAAADGERVK